MRVGPHQPNPEGERNTKHPKCRSEVGAHCMMDRGRTHHHTTKTRSEDHSGGQTIAMDFIFMKQQSAASSQSIADESVTLISVKEDKHQNLKRLQSSGHVRGWRKGDKPTKGLIGNAVMQLFCPVVKGRNGRTPFERLHGKRPHQEIVPVVDKVLSRAISTDPLNSNEPQIQTRHLA